jgi:hypothetical protein
MANTSDEIVQMGKFDILATYEYAKSLAEGHEESEAKQRGMVAAIMGAQIRLGLRASHGEKDDFADLKDRAEQKKKTTVTAASFDRQVKAKMGDFFDRVFLPAMKALVQAHVSYDEVKRKVGIPSTWGAKITGAQFAKRAAAATSPKTRKPR